MSAPLGASPMRRAAPVLWPALASLIALYLTRRYAAWPEPGAVPALDLVAERAPSDFALFRAWYWSAPAATTAAAAWLLTDLADHILSRGWPVFRAQVHRGTTHLLRRLRRSLTIRVFLSLSLGIAAAAWSFRHRPFPAFGDNSILDLIAVNDPTVYVLIHLWYLAVPGLVAFGLGLLLSGARRIWLDSLPEPGLHGRGVLPPWPLSPEDESPSLVLGELHHPLHAREVSRPEWLTIPERGLYTGVAIFGAVGTGKTTGCMRPFADQLFTWQAHDPAKRAAGLVLEVKGDFCHEVQELLADAGRADDYVELGLGGRWQWNPLASDMDSYSLAYTIATLLNQLFGRSKEPFWQQASTNLVRWIIELHRLLPGGWVTLQDIYRLTIDPDAFGAKLAAARAAAPTGNPALVEIDLADLDHPELPSLEWQPAPGDRLRHPSSPDLLDRLAALSIRFSSIPAREPPADDRSARLEAVERWYAKDWLALDTKLRTSIVEGISVFLSLFDLPDTARLFCPPAQAPTDPTDDEAPPARDNIPGGLLTPLPPLADLIESGKVLALNMPAGSNPALARAIGVLLKNAWLQSLLRRPAAMKRHPKRFWRPAVFICDEYQSFATVGEDDPSGDEKSFALTRQCRCIPIVATQSISSLRSVLAGNDAWRTLLQTLRTRIFLTLSDDSSADQASNMCGKVPRLTPSYSISESSKPAFSLVSGRAGSGQGGSVGTTKNYREQREPMFHARSFTLLQNYQAIALPYDGVRSLPATRLYLKPHYLPRDLPYWRAQDAGDI